MFTQTDVSGYKTTDCMFDTISEMINTCGHLSLGFVCSCCFFLCSAAKSVFFFNMMFLVFNVYKEQGILKTGLEMVCVLVVSVVQMPRSH